MQTQAPQSTSPAARAVSGVAAAAGFADLLAALGLGGSGAVPAPVDGQTAAAPRRAAARPIAAAAEAEPPPVDANPAQALALAAPPALVLPPQATQATAEATPSVGGRAQPAPVLAGDAAQMPTGSPAALTLQVPMQVSANAEVAMAARTSEQPQRSGVPAVAEPSLPAVTDSEQASAALPEATPIAPAPAPLVVIDMDGPDAAPAWIEADVVRSAQGPSSERTPPAARSSAASRPTGAAAGTSAVFSLQAGASAGVAATAAAGAAKPAGAVKEPTAAIPAAPPVDPAGPVIGGDPSLGAATAEGKGLSTAAPASAGTPAAPAVPTPPAAQIAVHITRHAAAGERMVISLSPEELGGVEIEIELDGEGHARAHIAVELPGTLELIQRDAPLLEKALEAAGLDLAPDALTFDLRRDGQPSQQQYREPGPAVPGFPLAGTADDAPQPPVRPPGPASRLLDLSV